MNVEAPQHRLRQKTNKRESIEMASENVGNSKTGPKLIFACSGAADVGAVADQAARKLMIEPAAIG